MIFTMADHQPPLPDAFYSNCAKSFELSSIANTLSISVPMLKVFISILSGYILAGIYSTIIKDLPAELKHLYLIISGFSINYFVNGGNAIHSFITILVSYILCAILYKNQYYTLINVTFNMIYLLIGYYFTQTDSYDVTWTLPQCILTIRLIGFGFNINDGQKPIENLSKDEKESCLKEVPTFLELASFCYFPSSFLVGPFYTFDRYKSFINNEYSNCNGRYKAGLRRFTYGILYLILRIIGSKYIPDSYLVSPEFGNLYFTQKILITALWFRITLYKYISIWLINEGALIFFGITYQDSGNKKSDDEIAEQDETNMWRGCESVNIRLFERAQNFESIIKSFNVKTNEFSSTYIYKRLKLLGNRNLSAALTLIFLSLWHGLHCGYLITFGSEFIVLKYERQIFKFTKMYIEPKLQPYRENKFIKLSIFIFLQIYVSAGMGFFLGPFVLLTWERSLLYLHILNYYVYIMLIGWFIFYGNVYLYLANVKEIFEEKVVGSRVVKYD